MKTDLKRLHSVHRTLYSEGSFGRSIGKTTYTCHLVAGYLEILKNETVLIILPKRSYVNFYVETMKNVLKEHDLEIENIDLSSYRIFIKDNSNNIKIMFKESLERIHPMGLGINDSLYPIIDFENQNGEWWRNKLNYTIRDLDKIFKK